jgi:phage shock protein PspC (stress-responsive transcriptional regulator)
MSTNLPPTDPAGATSTAPGSSDGPTSGPPATEFFDRIRGLGLVRPDDGRWVAGVSGAVARRTGLDVTLVRGLFVVTAVFGGGLGMVAYGLGWLLLPHPDGRIHAQEVLRGVVTGGFVGAVLTTLVGFPSGTSFHPGPGWDRGWGFNPGPLWLLLAIGLVVWAIRSRRGQQGERREPGTGSWVGTEMPTTQLPTSDAADTWTAGPRSGPDATWTAVRTPPVPDPTRPSHGLTRATLGLAVVAGAGVAIWDRSIADVPSTAAVAFAVALGMVALGIVLAGISGRRSGGLGPIAWVLGAVTLAAAAAANVDVERQDVTCRSTTTTIAEAGYDSGAGDVRIDLTDPAIRSGATAADPVDLSASLGVGRLVVVVPAGTATRVDARVGLGQIDDQVAGTGSADGSRSLSFTAGTGDVTVVVHARVGLGEIVVIPQGGTLALGATTPTATTTDLEALR